MMTASAAGEVDWDQAWRCSTACCSQTGAPERRHSLATDIDQLVEARAAVIGASPGGMKVFG